MKVSIAVEITMTLVCLPEDGSDSPPDWNEDGAAADDDNAGDDSGDITGVLNGSDGKTWRQKL
jgi:hypothetical protein